MQKRNTTEKKIKGFMKKGLILGMVAMMAVSATACGGNDNKKTSNKSTTSTSSSSSSQRKTRAAAQVRAPIPILIRAQRATLIRVRTAAPIRTQRAASLIKLPPVPAQTRAQPARIRATVLTDKLQKNSSRVCSQ